MPQRRTRRIDVHAILQQRVQFRSADQPQRRPYPVLPEGNRIGNAIAGQCRGFAGSDLAPVQRWDIGSHHGRTGNNQTFIVDCYLGVGARNRSTISERQRDVGVG